MRRTYQVRSVRLVALAVAMAASVGGLSFGSVSPARAATVRASLTRTASRTTTKVAAPTSPAALPGTFVSLTPARIVDTSTGTGTSKAPLAGGGVIKLAVLGRAGLPASGVAAVVLNVGASSSIAGGALTAYADGAARPAIPTVSFAAGSTASNLIFLKIPVSGTVDIYNGSAGSVQVTADVHGYFVAGTPKVPGAYVALAPQRIFDTSTGLNSTTGPIPSDGNVDLKLRGLGGIPNKGMDTVTANITVSGAAASGAISLGRGGPAVNSFVAGRTTSVATTLHAGPNGFVQFYNSSSGSVQLSIDVEGYTIAGVTLAPQLVAADTENGDNQPGAYTPTSSGNYLNANPVTAPAHGTAQVYLVEGSFPPGVGTVAFDFTTDGSQTAAGSLTAYATGSARPTTPDMSFVAGQAVTGFVLADADRIQQVTVYNSAASAVTFAVEPAGFYNQQRTPSLSWVPQVVDPPRGSLTDVSCPAPGSCTESDFYGNTIKQTASGWGHATPVFNFDGTGVQHLSCPTTSFCAAVEDSDVAVEQANVWSSYLPLAVAVNHTFLGITCASSSFCVAYDNFGGAYAWNGTTWSAPVVADTNGVSDVSCPANGVCFGIDSTGSVTQLANGVWRLTPHVVAGSPNGVNGDQISCPTTTFCEATSSQDAATYSGNAWHASTPISFAANLNFPAHLACASATLCMFASTGTAGIEWTTSDGHTWSSHPSLLTVTGLDCHGVSCVVVGSTYYDYDSSTQTQVFTGSAWAPPVVSDPLDAGDLVGVSCPTTSWCMAEDHGFYLVDTAGTWTWPTAFPAGVQVGHNLHCVSPTYCTVDAGHAVETWRGSSWTLGPKVTSSYLDQLSCPTTTFCMAVDQTGATFTFNGSAWKSIAKPGEGTAVLDCASSTFCAGASLAGLTDEAYVWKGSAWTSAVVPGTSTYLQQMTCPAVGSCVLMTDDGTIAELSGGVWTLDAALSSGDDGEGLSCVGTDTCQLLEGQTDMLPISDGWTGIPQRLFIGVNLDWGAVSCSTSATCIATTNFGVVFTGGVP